MSLIRLGTVFLCFTLLLCNCGMHNQSLTRKLAKDKRTSAGENDPVQVLINAVSSGDVTQVSNSIKSGLDVNVRDQEGLPLIMISIKTKQLAVMELLVKNGADLELETDDLSFYNPALNSWSFLEQKMQLDPEIKDIYTKILKGEEFSVEALSDFMFTSVDFSDKYLMGWLLNKGMSPNTIYYTGGKKDKPKHSVLIYLFKRNRTAKEDLKKLREVFELLVIHPEIDLNLKVKKDTPLKKAQSRWKNKSGKIKNAAYGVFVNRLIELGAR